MKVHRSMRYTAWHTSGDTVRLLGRDVFLRTSGTGPALLFLHGFPTSSYDWSDVIATLASHHRCVTFDFAGFGASAPPDHYDYDHQTDLALAVAAHLGLTRCTLVAHDYGVSVAQELLARRPAALTLDGVVFLNGGVEPRLHRPIALQRLLAGPLGALIGPLVVSERTFTRSMRRLLARPERFDMHEHWQAIHAHGSHRRTHDLLHYIAERRHRRDRWVDAFTDRSTRVGLVWGERDPVSGAHVLEWARARRPDAEVLALPVGHYPQIEAADEVAEFIARFAAGR